MMASVTSAEICQPLPAVARCEMDGSRLPRPHPRMLPSHLGREQGTRSGGTLMDVYLKSPWNG